MGGGDEIVHCLSSSLIVSNLRGGWFNLATAIWKAYRISSCKFCLLSTYFLSTTADHEVSFVSQSAKNQAAARSHQSHDLMGCGWHRARGLCLLVVEAGEWRGWWR